MDKSYDTRFIFDLASTFSSQFGRYIIIKEPMECFGGDFAFLQVVRELFKTREREVRYAYPDTVIVVDPQLDC